MSRRLLLWTALPVALLMIHFARQGTAVSFPARRPGAPTLYTWEESPVGFVLYGIMAYGVTCVIVLIFQVFVRFAWEEIRLRRRGRRW